MYQVDECIGLLVDALKESPEYQKYRETYAKIHMDPEKERQVNEFRKRSYLLQVNKEQGDLFTEMDSLYQESAPLRAQPDVSEYLAAELALCRIVQHINYRLMQEIDFD